MKLFYKYSLSAMAALSSLVGCADKPQPPEPTPTPTVVKTNVSGISGMDVILRTPDAKAGVSYEYTVTGNTGIGVSTDNHGKVKLVKEFDARRNDVTVNFGDLKIYYPDGTLLGFQPWVSETGSFPIGPNENGNWPETNGDEALFAAAGYHDIKNIVIVTVIDMSAEMADDADKLAVAIKSAKEQNTDNNKIRLETNNRSFFINKENLMDLTCEYISPTGACIFLDVDDVKIRGIISKDGEYSYNMGYNTAPWAWLSEVNGQVTQWLMKPDNESGIIDRMSVQIGGEEENIIAYPSAGRLVAITPEVLPANTIVKGTYGDRLSWDAYFQVDLKENMLVGKAGSEFDNSLIQSPGPGPDMIFNSGKTGAYLSDEIKIGVTNYLSSLVKVPNYSSTQMKTLPECAGKVAVDLPDWAADLPKKRGLSR